MPRGQYEPPTPVTSVDGLTGVVDLSATYVRVQHNSNTTGDTVIGSTAFVTPTAGAIAGGIPAAVTIFGGTQDQPHSYGDQSVMTISGGYDNHIADNCVAGTISGGAHHNILTGATHGTIGGGSYNTVSTGGYAVVAGGTLNTASAIQAAVSGGGNNTASGQSATVVGGTTNTASGQEAIAGGGNNTASGLYAVALGKQGVASGTASMTTGNFALASVYGKKAHAAGVFVSRGDAQTGQFVLRNQTTDGSATDLFADGTSARMVMANDTAWVFDILVAGRRTDADGENACYRFTGLIGRDTNAASTALVGTPVKTVIAEADAAWDVAVTARTTDGSLNVTVTGEAAKTVNWVAFVRTVEVTG